MYTDIPVWLAALFLAGGLAALAWSSDVFVDGAAAVAKRLGISSFIIGMVVIGFGTSAPELCVSAMSGASGHSSLSIGNAYGSCIFNIAAILGIAMLIRPIVVKRSTAFVAGPLLAALSAVSWFLVKDGACSRSDAWVLIGVFAVLLPLYCWFDQKTSGAAGDGGDAADGGSLTKPVLKVAVGLAVLVGSSHFLVWGAVDVARALGVSELAIGLTIVAAGTSLPELASAVASARRGENEFILGNIIGSNLFNTLAVVGIACAIEPAADYSSSVWTRDLPVMAAMSLAIAVFGANWRRPRECGVMGRFAGVLLLAAFAAYTAALVRGEMAEASTRSASRDAASGTASARILDDISASRS